MFYKKLPLVNFTLATSALIFQTTVIYPLHKDIIKQLTNLEKKIDTYKNKI
uniref:Uncharacterized protein n=1 Tax=viral metagenome TaxID=1070528 RepID=A0A6C0IF73_9ZZZZ